MKKLRTVFTVCLILLSALFVLSGCSKNKDGADNSDTLQSTAEPSSDPTADVPAINDQTSIELIFNTPAPVTSDGSEVVDPDNVGQDGVTDSIPISQDNGLIYVYIKLQDTGTSLNIRKSASVSSDILGTLKHGDMVQLVEFYSDWINIRFGEISGYIKTSFVSVNAPD